MKKAISIVFIFIFLFSSSGFSITTHYCKGKLQSVNILFGKKGCSCGKKKMSKDCCKDKTNIVKISDNFIPPSATIAPSMEIIALANTGIQTFYLSTIEKSRVESNLNYLHPPDKPISLSILYRSILI